MALTEWVVDCSTGLAAEVGMDAAEERAREAKMAPARAARAAQERRAQAAERVKAHVAASGDPFLRDLLTALGLE
jgi:hypothetical protein